LVPKVVISGFMNGIAVLIWYGEVKNFFGLGGKEAMTGNLGINIGIALMVTLMIFNFGKVTGKLCPAYKSFFPGTLIVIVVVTALVKACGGLGIQTVKTGDPINSFDDITGMFSTNFPSIWSGAFLMKALPNAITLTVLGYLDTLLTSLVVDQKVDEKFSKSNRWPKTAKNQELVAQGAANAAVAFFGGLPGAQATIRSVLILNEGAMTRMAGISVGILVIVEMLALQSLIGFIPQCVFSGILLKVGYDVFDWTPFFIYLQTQVARKEHPAVSDTSREEDPVVSHMNFFFILGASVVTVVFGLNQAVGAFTLLYWLVHKLVMPVPDLVSYAEARAEKVAPADADAAVLA
jgi:SulP family sulfate permease